MTDIMNCRMDSQKHTTLRLAFEFGVDIEYRSVNNGKGLER